MLDILKNLSGTVVPNNTKKVVVGIITGGTLLHMYTGVALEIDLHIGPAMRTIEQEIP